MMAQAQECGADVFFCIPDAVVGGVANSTLSGLADAASKGAAEMIKLTLASWVNVPALELNQDAGVIGFLRESTVWIVGALAVCSLFVVAIRTALQRDGREMAQSARGMVWLVLLTGGGIAVINYLNKIGDLYSGWILDRAAKGHLAERMVVLVPTAGAMGLLSPIVIIIVGLFAATLLLVQIVLLYGRDAIMILLAGLLPVAGAAGVMGGGRQMRDKYLGWLLAAILYKPVAATIFAVGIRLVGDGKNVREAILGLVTIAMSVVALPALQRLVVPAVAAVTGSGTGATALAGAMPLASGALNMAGGRGRGKTTSGGPDSGGGEPPSGGVTPALPAGPPSGGELVPTGAAGPATAGGGAAAAGGGAAMAAGPAGAAVAGGVAVVGKAVGVAKAAAQTAASGAGGDQ